MSRGLWLDALGVALFGAALAWTNAGAAPAGEPGPTLGALAVCAGVLIVGLTAGRIQPLILPVAVVVAGAALAIGSPSGVLSDAPVAGPFGYANAKAAFFLQVGIAGLMVAVGSQLMPGKVLGTVAAVAALTVPLSARSFAASALACVPLVAVAFASNPPRARTVILGCSGLVAAALLATIVLGATYSGTNGGGVVGRSIAATITERRVTLWHDALSMVGDHPLRGVGPGRFKVVSPEARLDPDARWAHHGFLQQAAETGIPGLVLTIAIFGWGFARLGMSPDPNRVTALGAAALAALGVHASLDYVLHFPAVPAAAASLVATGAHWPREPVRGASSPLVGA